MNYEYYSQYFNEKTRIKNDITPAFQHPKVFSQLLNDLVKPFNKTKIDKIAGLDAMGFILGAALASKKKVGFIPVRKGGKLPDTKKNKVSLSFTDYTRKKKSLEINKSAIRKGEKILLVDEWIETGAQMKTTVKLVERLGGRVVGITVIGCEKRKETKILFEKYKIHCLKLIEKK